MKDEEMAEEYAEGKGHERYNFIFEKNAGSPKDFAKLCFLDGYHECQKEHEWHDLKKDPDDLPKDNEEKLCFYGKGKVVARYDSEYGNWETYFNNLVTTFSSSILIGWCEIPTFDKE